MLGNILNSSTIPALEQVAVFSQHRHELLAGNVANLDTPGYKVRDLSLDDFRAELKEAIALQKQQQRPVSLGSDSFQKVDPLAGVKESMKNILFHDDSNVGMEQQVIEIANNSFMHNMALSIMNSQFQLLRTAISERV